MYGNFFCYASDYACVLLKKLKPRLSGFLSDACRDYHEARICIIFGSTDPDGHRGEERLPVNKIENLSLCQSFIFIDEHNIIGKSALRKRIAIC